MCEKVAGFGNNVKKQHLPLASTKAVQDKIQKTINAHHYNSDLLVFVDLYSVGG